MFASIRRAIAAALVLAAAGCVSAPKGFQPSPAEARLLELMNDRLALSREVAWIKYQNRIPIRDPQREATLLQNLTAKAAAMGVREEAAREFLLAQMTASRRLQESEIRKWTRGGRLPAMAPRELVPDVRDDIERVTVEMLQLLPGVRTQPATRDYLAAGLMRRGIPRNIALAATAPIARASATR